MNRYGKLIAAFVGLAVLVGLPILGKKFGIDYFQEQQIMFQIIVAFLTAAGVWGVPNKPKDEE